MKLYDFHCHECGVDFEELVRDVCEARCPTCASSRVEKQLSSFAVGGGRGEPSAPAGGCGGGFCSSGGCGLG